MKSTDNPIRTQTGAAPLDAGDGACGIAEAAALLGVSRVTVWRWIRDGRLPATRLGHRTIRIRRADLAHIPVPVAPARLDSARSAAAGDVSRIASPWADPAVTHVVQFYDADAFLIDEVADFIGAALDGGDAGIAIATEAHRAGIEARLRARGLEMDLLRGEGRYASLNAAETLHAILIDGELSRERFTRVVGDAVASAAGGRRVRVFGEMVALLIDRGDAAGTLRLEDLWNDLLRTQPFLLLCGYPIGGFAGEAAAETFRAICDRHHRVMPAEGFAALPDPDDRLRLIADLQQQAESLVADRIRAAERDRALAAIVTASDDAIITKTLDGTITSWNPAAERLYGWTAAEMVGQSIARIVPPDKRDELADILARLGRGEHIDHHETARVTKDGRRLDVSVSISPLVDATGRVVGAAKIARDVTDRKRAEALREEVFATVSHDLKNPLGGVKGIAQLLLRALRRGEAPDSERLERDLVAIDEAVGRMVGLIDDLVATAQMRAGEALVLTPEPVDLVALAWRCVEQYQATTQQHALRLVAEVPELVGTWDRARLERVVANLLTNALKYSPHGGEVVVRVAREEEAAGTWAVLAVRDQGVGIPAADLPHVFDQFQRGSNVGAIAGTGLGLAAARQIVAQHGGAIGLESELGVGSTFIVRLPLVADANRQ